LFCSSKSVLNAGVLEKYFAEGAYRFQMQFERGAFARFYNPTDEHAEIIAERELWLRTAEQQCLALLPEGDAILDEAVRLADLPRAPDDYRSKAKALGTFWEPDYLLLKKTAGDIRLVCACVCFPSSWVVEEKIGRPIEEIHEFVPGLNAAIGRQIHTFLERMKPGVSWTRSNWGLSRSPERNQHPSRRLPRLDENVRPDEIFFRVEEQSLIALPETEGILFGIRIKIHPLSEFRESEAGQRLRYALETMPDEMARYKGLALARSRIISYLPSR
jgi:dimethylamine monooxygenase subunit A